MSITVVKDKSATVITLASDEKSMLPPLCQVLKTLCYSPMCCSVNKTLMRTNTVLVLGTIQIMVGLFSIALGPGRTSLHPEDFAHLGVAYWLGGVLIFAGILSVFVALFPSACLVVFAVLTNIIAAVVIIVGIVLCAIDVKEVSARSMCDWGRYNTRNDDDNCKGVEFVFKRLLVAMDISMIVLTVLQLFVCIGVVVIGISALGSLRKKEGVKADKADEQLLKDVFVTSPGA
ncbi:uncharacterized protein LOC121945118 isoform X2 [Plectropomus leopardus]|uniref:uncharacterized protein LOC121938316 isoform X2 n=1 Tax=Plectropomus leopardus TaxID=160734 RepID=UPI001C4D72B0|nr:uncharacterized protein LOC121938316 isoform X2 [Plectropomus leopardus]XP_042345077.1 uncharacterized protein LOC121945118 isoform X2 [Plectropomus leopardus]